MHDRGFDVAHANKCCQRIANLLEACLLANGLKLHDEVHRRVDIASRQCFDHELLYCFSYQPRNKLSFVLITISQNHATGLVSVYTLEIGRERHSLED